MGRVGATERLERLLAYVPWIVDRDGPTIDEVCARFGITEKQLLADLSILPFIGLPPYTPDTLVEVTVEEGRVWIHYADFFSRPLRLTPEEGLALIAAGAAVRGLPGHDEDGPLERGLAKLAGVLGVDPAMVDTGPADEQVLETLTTAAREHRQVDLSYYSYGRDERTERRIEPWRVFLDRGSWYVVGYCHRAEGERVFRVDRIESVEATDVVFEPPANGAPVGVFTPNPDDPRVTLELGPPSRWVIEHYPVEEVTELDGGRLRVRMAVAAGPWFERLMLRLGADAVLVETTDESLREAGPRAAARVLGRYR